MYSITSTSKTSHTEIAGFINNNLLLLKEAIETARGGGRNFEIFTKPASKLCERVITLPTPQPKGNRVMCDAIEIEMNSETGKRLRYSYGTPNGDAIIYIPYDETTNSFPIIFFD